MSTTTTARHTCHVAYVVPGDIVRRLDGSSGTVVDVQHYREPFVGRVADVRMSDGRRYNGAPISGRITVTAGPDHPDHG